MQTVLMVEEFIKDNSMFYTRREIFSNLPKKMLWGTFRIIIDYLEETLKIMVDDDGIVSYIWNPELAKRLRKRNDLKWR